MQISISESVSWRIQLRLQEREETTVVAMTKDGVQQLLKLEFLGSQQLGHYMCKCIRNNWSTTLLTLQYFIPTTQLAPHIPGNFSDPPLNKNYFQNLHPRDSLND